MDHETRLLNRLHDLGFRLTEPRRRVVCAITRQHEPFSGDDLFEELRQQDNGVGRATVFRTLDLLVSLRALDRIHRPDGTHCYIVGSPGHHHHIVCSNCGAVAEIEDCNVSELVDSLAVRTNFRIDGHWLEFYGLCTRCQ